MCSPSLVNKEPTTVITSAAAIVKMESTTNSHSPRRVSFQGAPEVILVDRLDLSFYTSEDFAKFRQETQEEVFQTKQAKLLLEKRKRGYKLLAGRRQQRSTKKCSVAVAVNSTSHLSSLALAGH